MPTGRFGGFDFDPEVYGSFVDQEPVFTDSIIASGILASDTNMTRLLDNGGTVGTTRFYNPLDPDADAPLVRDGKNNNVPVEVSGGKQSYIRMDRMKAWKANQLVRELTAAKPLQAVARHTARYWRMYRQGLLIKTANAVLGLSGLSTHVITATGGVNSGLLIDGQQAALGEFADKFGMIVMHSKILAEYKKLGLVDFNKYTITNVLQHEVNLPTINGLIVVVNDRGTSHVIEEGAESKKTQVTIYDCFLFGQGCFLEATPSVTTPDYTDYNPELGGGTDVLYNTRSWILHPNGVSILADNIAGDTPTDAELANKANWALRFEHQNVRIGKIEIRADKLSA